MKKIVYKACIITLMIGAAIGYALGEYDGDIIEPTAKYMKDRKIDYSSMSEDEICWKIHPSKATKGKGRYPGVNPTPAQDIFQGVERVAVIFERQNSWNRNYIACIDGNVEEACAYKHVAHSVKSKKDAFEKSDKILVPSTLFPAVESAVKDLFSCQKKDIPITLHYLPTDDIFYKKGTLALNIDITARSHLNSFSIGAGLFRPDMGFSNFSNQNIYWKKYDFDPEKPRDFKEYLSKHLRVILRK